MRIPIITLLALAVSVFQLWTPMPAFGEDDAQAVMRYRKAAEQGDASGQFNLGWMYANGRGVTQSDAEAAKWYRKAAEQGNADAQANLGWMYANGRGVAKDEPEAVKWLRKAAEQGNAGAQANLGVMYANGRGVAKDEAESVKWFRKAAEQGNAFGQSRLGAMYATGRGVAKDEAESVKWFRKATEQAEARETQGSQAEKAGHSREAMDDYLDALRSLVGSSPVATEVEQRLRERIIKLVLRLNPPPAIPDEAERHLVRGAAAMKSARDPQGFLEAANEFQQTLQLAPWLADGYYDLGSALGKAGKSAEAIRSLKLYLLAAPQAADAKQVKDLIYDMEYRQEKAGH